MSADSGLFFLSCYIHYSKSLNGFLLPITYRLAQKSLHMKIEMLYLSLAPMDTNSFYSTGPTFLDFLSGKS